VVGAVDLVPLFVKSHATAEAMADAGPLLGPETDVLTLQNGLGNAETIAEFVAPERVLAGVTTHGAILREPGTVVHTGRGDTALGRWASESDGRDSNPGLPDDDTGAADEKARAVATRLTTAGIPTEVVADPERLVWEKVLVNVGINAPTALARVENGTLARAAPGQRLLSEAVTEAERVARALGHDVRDDIVDYARSVAERTAANRSSMRIDLESGRRTEVEALYGAVIDRAQRAGIEVPVLRTLADLVRLAERNEERRETPEALLQAAKAEHRHPHQANSRKTARSDSRMIQSRPRSSRGSGREAFVIPPRGPSLQPLASLARQ
jgi:2-dehydropantoate 2-reductase